MPWDKHRGDIAVRIRAIAENIYNGNPMTMDNLEILDPKHPALSGINNIMDYFNNSGYFYPLLFMPLTGKDYSFISNFKDIMITKAEEMLSQATDIYLIGYRAKDDLIQDLLNKAPNGTKLHIIGGGSANEISKRILDTHKNLIEGLIDNQGFSAFVSGF